MPGYAIATWILSCLLAVVGLAGAVGLWYRRTDGGGLQRTRPPQNTSTREYNSWLSNMSNEGGHKQQTNYDEKYKSRYVEK